MLRTGKEDAGQDDDDNVSGGAKYVHAILPPNPVNQLRFPIPFTGYDDPDIIHGSPTGPTVVLTSATKWAPWGTIPAAIRIRRPLG